MAVTIFDVAERAGVSISTVSRVLNGKDRVHADTARRVQEAVNELGFRQNALARALVTRRSEMVGLVIPKVNDPFHFEIVRGVEDAVSASNHSLLIVSQTRNEGEERNLSPFQRGLVDAIIAVAVDLNRAEMADLLHRNVPVVLIQRTRGDDIPAFVVDNYGGACQLAEHLLTHGYRRFAYISGSNLTCDSAERQRGLRDVLSGAGLLLGERYIVQGDYLRGSGYRAMQALLELDPLPEVVFAANDQMASDALIAITERDLRVPNDIAIAGFDDIPLASYITPGLTTVHQPTYELGFQAAKAALNMVKEEKPIESKQVVLPTRLVVRHSCGCH
jgi:LacI family transcriptional regulator